MEFLQWNLGQTSVGFHVVFNDTSPTETQVFPVLKLLQCTVSFDLKSRS